MTETMPCELVSWPAVHRLSRTLSDKIRAAGFVPQVVVAIARGGYVPARLLCDHLDLYDLTSIRIVHYQAGAQMRRKAELVEGLCRDLAGKSVLLVDDVSDTGDTLVLARNHLLQQGASRVCIAVLHHKQSSSLTPDFYGQRVIKWRWLIYPWAQVEDVSGFLQRLPEYPSTPAEAGSQLLSAFGIRVPERLLVEVMSHGRSHR